MTTRFKLLISAVLMPLMLPAQSVYAPIDPFYNHLIDREEILSGGTSNELHTSFKPYSRQAVAEILATDTARQYSKVDEFNRTYLLNDNWEWANDDSAGMSKKPILRHFYTRQNSLYSYSDSTVMVQVNPVLNVWAGQETAYSDKNYLNTRGLEVRGLIGKKVGFYTYLADNQAVFPGYVRAQSVAANTVPGEGFWKYFKGNTGRDFLSARGYVTFSPIKQIAVQFGHDRNFIGNGYRSLILSDFANPYTFLKLSTKVWKLQYTNLFASMHASAQLPGDNLIPKKYAAYHHLSLNIGKHINIGLFESIAFGRKDSLTNGNYELEYMNPVIFYRWAEQNTGSPDNVMLGLDYKVNFLKHFSLYGQVVLDEFVLKQIVGRTGWWANKQAAQVGLKYINAFGVKNLDLHGEFNLVRPFMYTHKDQFANYAHHNQPLVHPLGANFYEGVGIIRYQPIPRLSLTGKLLTAIQGLDKGDVKSGSNVLDNYLLNANEQKMVYKTAGGLRATWMYADFLVSYMLRHNLFVDFNAVNRAVVLEGKKIDDNNTLFFSAGVRWNAARRMHVF